LGQGSDGDRDAALNGAVDFDVELIRAEAIEHDAGDVGDQAELRGDDRRIVGDVEEESGMLMTGLPSALTRRMPIF